MLGRAHFLLSGLRCGQTPMLLRRRKAIATCVSSPPTPEGWHRESPRPGVPEPGASSLGAARARDHVPQRRFGSAGKSPALHKRHNRLDGQGHARAQTQHARSSMAPSFASLSPARSGSHRPRKENFGSPQPGGAPSLPVTLLGSGRRSGSPERRSQEGFPGCTPPLACLPARLTRSQASVAGRPSRRPGRQRATRKEPLRPWQPLLRWE